MARNVCLNSLRSLQESAPHQSLYFCKNALDYESASVSSFHAKVRHFAKSLIAQGVSKQGKVAILGENCLEWVIACLGSQYIGAVSVGIYQTCSKEEVLYQVSHCDAEILIVEDRAKYEKQVQPIISKLTNIKKVIFMKDNHLSDDGMGFEEFLAIGKSICDSEVENYFNLVKDSDIATMIYTSGTTSRPKAVMLSHSSICWTVNSVASAYNCSAQDRIISYLPLAHIAEQMFTVYAPMMFGIQSYFCPNMEELPQAIKVVQPTLFFGVPRVYEKLQQAIITQLQKRGKPFFLFAKYLLQSLSTDKKKQLNNENNSFWGNFISRFAKKTLVKKIVSQAGLSKLRILFSGAAPLSMSTLEFFLGLDMIIHEVYGQSEGSGATSFNTLESIKIGSVGRPFEGSQIKLGDDNEILLKGPQVFNGYYKDEKNTNEVLKDEWLHSGDIGKIDKDGYLFIVGRKKEILITSGGKNISPQSIEEMLNTLPFVQSSVVIGDNKKYLSAIFAPDLKKIQQKFLNGQKDSSFDPSIQIYAQVIKEVEESLKDINQKLSKVEQIKKFSFVPKEFSVDSGEFTPTMKLKRSFITQKYESFIEKMYV